MKLFITGICGRLGRAVVAEAGKLGWQSVGVDMQDWPVKAGPKPADVEVEVGSFDDQALLERMIPGCDAIVHTAGPHGLNVKTLDLAGFCQAHVVGVARMLTVGRQHGVRHAALSSTMEVQIGRTWLASGAAMLDESMPPRTDSAYSLSRVLMENLGREFARQSGMSIASLRFMAFGDTATRRMGPSLLARALTDVDVAWAVIKALQHGKLAGETFNIGPATPITTADLPAIMEDPLAVLEKHFPGSWAVLQREGFKLTRNWFWPIADTRQARLILGWEPRYTFEHWLLEHGWQRPQSQPADVATSAAK
jgi:nucleoside-diphosphate-sugar epimerase